MCIALFTTAHPDYALIVLDNRDEYILRPTSRPHWWSHPTSGHEVLSSRDLQRAEQGTWLGITKEGYLAVLTNYREPAATPVSGARSRGGMVTAWLGGLPREGVKHGVDQLVRDGGVQGVGGFSMVCSKLRRRGEGLAIVSNRAADVDQVPVIARERGQVWGLSNAVYGGSEDDEWPKVQLGKRLLLDALKDAESSSSSSQETLIERLFSVLDRDTLPAQEPDTGFKEYINQLKHSIFIPAIGDAAHREAMTASAAKGPATWEAQHGRHRQQQQHQPEEKEKQEKAAEEELEAEMRPDAATGPFETGMYGTQRQTVVLVDWEGNVTFVERALWDGNGNAVSRGQGDVTFRFKIEGWDE